jgi:hypothetical protein
MDRERAETYLRQLIEAELRRAAAQYPGTAAEAGCIARVLRIATALIAAGCLSEDAVLELVDELTLALLVRRAGWPLDPADPALRSRLRRPPRHPAAPQARHPAAPQARHPAAPQAGHQAAPPLAADRVVPVGQLIPVRGAAASGEICLLSYAHTDGGALLTLVAAGGPFGLMEPVAAWAGSPAGQFTHWRQVEPSFSQFRATDATGTSYRMTYRGNSPHPGEWTLRLSPAPPRDLGWLDLRTSPDGPAVRIDLDGPPASIEVTVSEAAASPGEQLLGNLAMHLLTAPPAGSTGPPTDVLDGLGDVLAALQAAGALSPLSPVPGQFAALCVQLNLAGHGITAPPARDLPAPWLSLLAHRRRRKPRPVPAHDGYAAAAVGLPELDGVRLSLLGLHNSGDGTIARMYVSRQARWTYWGPAQLNMAPVIWIRDSGSRWHGTRFVRLGEGDLATRLQVVPPLSGSTTWIEIYVAGQSAEVRATVPLRWR